MYFFNKKTLKTTLSHPEHLEYYMMIAEDDPEKETLWKDKLGSPKLPTRVLTQHS
jgi:hypothetical protein